MLNNYSNQQIITNIVIQSMGLAKANNPSFPTYGYFFLIWVLSLLFMATHNAALPAAILDVHQPHSCRAARATSLVLRSKIRGLPSPLPIACVCRIKLASNVLQGSTVGLLMAGIAIGKPLDPWKRYLLTLALFSLSSKLLTRRPIEQS